ncbi:MAG: terminase large subunit [Planctomycetaceae bacterium]|nr:terminase large subunit [Planctomycetota bacterium]NUN51367.1 terminase large subunit [Planctomycetaceae bacterium]
MSPWNALALERWPAVTIPVHDHGGRYFFDEEEAARAVDFFPTFLRHLTGEFAGQPFDLLDWQRELLVRPLFGWKRASDGLRRFRKVFIVIGKKNGKSACISGLGLYLLHCDREPGAEIVAAAADREQAGIVFNEARDMNAASRRLAARSETYRRAIVVPETRSSFKVVSSEVKGRHGPNIHALLFDEFHTQPNRDLYDTLSKGIAARRQPIVVLITTAGDDQDSVCYEEYEYAKRVMSGLIEDETYLPVIFEAKEGDDWRDPRIWAKANPSLGVTVKRDYLEAECRAAQAEPRKQGAFKRLHLNIWTRTNEVWIPIEWWKDCPSLPGPESLVKRPVAGGLDLSSTTDLTAFVLVFRLPESRLEGEKVPTVQAVEFDAAGAPVKKVLSINYDLAVLPFLWMPEERLHERSKEDGVDYGVWVREGHLRTTPGSVVDYDFIFRTIVDELAPRYRVKEIGYDPWNALQFALQLEKAGLQPVEVRQGPKTLSTSCKVLHALTRARRVHHDGNRAMSWCVSNAAVKEDENENIRPVKANPKRRIDGVVATVTALSRLMVLPSGPASPYATRGVRTV